MKFPPVTLFLVISNILELCWQLAICEPSERRSIRFVVEVIACEFFAIAKKFADKLVQVFKPFKILSANLKKVLSTCIIDIFHFFSSVLVLFSFFSLFPYFLLSSFRSPQISWSKGADA